LGVRVLTALCGSLLGRNTRAALSLWVRLLLGGYAVRVGKLAIEKRAQTLLMPVWRDDSSTILPMIFRQKASKDVADAVFKALVK